MHKFAIDISATTRTVIQFTNGPSVQRTWTGRNVHGPRLWAKHIKRFELPIVAGRARDQLDYVKVGYISSPAETMRGL